MTYNYITLINDGSQQFLIFVLVQSIKPRSSTRLTELLPNKQCCLIASLQKKDYLQINVFLGSGSKIEKNLKVLLIKAIKSFDGGARGEILSSINKSLEESYSIVVKNWVT